MSNDVINDVYVVPINDLIDHHLIGTVHAWPRPSSQPKQDDGLGRLAHLP